MKVIKDLFQQERTKKCQGKIITEFCTVRAEAYAYLINGYDHCWYDREKINKKAKGTKKCVIKRRLMLENYKDCLFNDKRSNVHRRSQ